MNVALDSNDDTVDRIATLTFPNYTFAAGDSVTCKLVAGTPAPTTVVDTTVVETTVVETTVVETTEVTTTTVETTVPATTVAPTTVPPETTTTSIDIPPPVPGETLWDLIDAAPSLSEFKQFVIDAGFQSALEDPNATFTIFAPTNEAIDAARAELEAGTVPVDSDTISEHPARPRQRHRGDRARRSVAAAEHRGAVRWAAADHGRSAHGRWRQHLRPGAARLQRRAVSDRQGPDAATLIRRVVRHRSGAGRLP